MNGVVKYVHGVAHVPVHFPDEKTDCRHCEFCYYKDEFSVYRCRLTGEFIDRADLDRRGAGCPVELEETHEQYGNL